jgi:hypothetical protein
MMLTYDDLKRLANVCGPCLTVIQPLRESPDANPVTNIVAAIREAGRLLAEKGFNDIEREAMLRPLLKLAANTDWKGRGGTLVIFRAPDFTMANFWPDVLAPRVRFAPEFLVLPLLPGLLSKRDFWLLGLSIKAVRLFRGSPQGLVQAALPPGVPASLAQDEAFDQPGHVLRNRSTAGRSGRALKVVPFGTSTERELRVDRLHDFFRAIDRGIHAILAEDPQPLILAGVTREVAIYRSGNTYSNVLAGAVHGSPEALGPDLLYSKAAALITAYSAQATAATLREMEEAAGFGLLATDPVAVVEAASRGQVDELIVSPAAPGFHQREEMVNWAALATVRGGGRISALAAPQPARGVAAILRFRSAGSGDLLPQYTVEEIAHRP